MIERMVETKTPSKWSPRVFNYVRHYVPAEFGSVEELIAHYQAQGTPDYGIGCSHLDNYITYHFPATTQNRDIYRVKVSDEELLPVGVYIMPLNK